MAEIVKNNEYYYIFKKLPNNIPVYYTTNAITGERITNESETKRYTDKCVDDITYRPCRLYKPTENIASLNPLIDVKNHGMYIYRKSAATGTVTMATDPDIRVNSNLLKIARFNEWESSKIPANCRLVTENASSIYTFHGVEDCINNNPEDSSGIYSWKHCSQINGVFKSYYDEHPDELTRPVNYNRLNIPGGNDRMYVSNIPCSTFAGPNLELGFTIIVGGDKIESLVNNDSYIAVGIKGISRADHTSGGVIGIYKTKTDLHAKKIKNNCYIFHIDDVTLGNMDLFRTPRCQFHPDTNTADVFFTKPILFNINEKYVNTTNNVTTDLNLYPNNFDDSNLTLYYAESILRLKSGNISRTTGSTISITKTVNHTKTTTETLYTGLSFDGLTTDYNNKAFYIDIQFTVTIPGISSNSSTDPIKLNTEISSTNIESIYNAAYYYKSSELYEANKKLSADEKLSDDNIKSLASDYANHCMFWTIPLEIPKSSFSSSNKTAIISQKYHLGINRKLDSPHGDFSDFEKVFLRNITVPSWVSTGDITISASVTRFYK